VSRNRNGISQASPGHHSPGAEDRPARQQAMMTQTAWVADSGSDPWEARLGARRHDARIQSGSHVSYSAGVSPGSRDGRY
jgi:hypothetical protein